MKNELFINNSLLFNFWAKTIDISNYLWTKLSIKYFKYKIITEKI